MISIKWFYTTGNHPLRFSSTHQNATVVVVQSVSGLITYHWIHTVHNVWCMRPKLSYLRSHSRRRCLCANIKLRNLAGHLDPHSAERVLSMKFFAAIPLPTRRFISIPTQETGIKRMALVIWSKWEWLFSYNHYISFGAVASFLLGCDEDINWHIMAPHPPSYQSGAENLPQQTT